MPDDTFVADVLRSSTEDGDPRINVGENTNGLGFGADTALWANGDGFLAIPNPPSDEGAAQVVAIQDGNTKRAIASRDNRFAGNAGDLQPGDRAIVSDSEAWIKLTRASDTIELVSGSMSVTINGAGGTITLTRGLEKIEIGPASIAIRVDSLFLPTAHVILTPSGVVIGGTTVVINNIPYPPP